MILPEAFLQSLADVPGFDRGAFVECHQANAPITSVRLNPDKQITLHENWQTQEVPWCSEGRYLATRPSFTQDPFLHGGGYYVQEASSMFIWHILTQLFKRTDSMQILDLCAAPGGKSTLLASYFQQALLVANEVIKSRAGILVENLVKWGSPNTVVTNNDPTHFKQLPGFFDLMLVDAPCSGSGLFRKDPAALDEWSEEAVMLCSRRQQRILADVLPALKEGGILLFATCSYSVEEDEAITKWLMEEMQMEAVHISVPAAWGIVAADIPGAFRFFPNRLAGEGFYISVLRKQQLVQEEYYKENALLQPNKNSAQLFREKFHLSENTSVFLQGNLVRSIPSVHWKAVQQLAAALYIKKAGVELGEEKGKDIIPSHEWAMQNDLKEGWPVINLNLSEALAYLGRQPLTLEAANGWNLVSYQGCMLGWVKIIQHRLNNYYPTHWRILKIGG
ncbi:MAG: RNA methyltransferase [Bacteroidetes bacterium]|nr:RNA methyltransferase [Bacteroidota bacterium]